MWAGQEEGGRKLRNVTGIGMWSTWGLVIKLKEWAHCTIVQWPRESQGMSIKWKGGWPYCNGRPDRPPLGYIRGGVESVHFIHLLLLELVKITRGWRIGVLNPGSSPSLLCTPPCETDHTLYLNLRVSPPGTVPYCNLIECDLINISLKVPYWVLNLKIPTVPRGAWAAPHFQCLWTNLVTTIL